MNILNGLYDEVDVADSLNFPQTSKLEVHIFHKLSKLFNFF